MRASSYLELNWLAKSDKDILLPPVVFADISTGGTFVYPKRKKEYLINNKFYPLDRGLIIVDEAYSCDEEIKGVLAHEWRHLWQFHQGWIEKDYVGWNSISPHFSYHKKIVTYFMSSPKEYDALLFEIKKAPTDYVLEWYEWIIKR